MSHQVSPSLISHPFKLDEIQIDPARRTLTLAGKVVSIQPRVMHVLCTLAAHYPDYVDRDALITAVWGTEHVTANALSNAVSKLRHHLGDESGIPRYVQTERSLGYRLLVEPRPLQAMDGDRVGRTGETLGGTSKFLWVIAALLVAILALTWRVLKTEDDRDGLTDFLIDNPGNWVIDVKQPTDDETTEDDSEPEEIQ